MAINDAPIVVVGVMLIRSNVLEVNLARDARTLNMLLHASTQLGTVKWQWRKGMLLSKA